MSTTINPTKERFWRVYQISLETSVRKGAASKAITEYLQSIGFTQTQISPTLLFERGSNLASLYNFNPKSQKTEVSVDFASAGEQTIVELTMRINCFANQPLSKDYEFWAAELDGIQDALDHGYVNPAISDFAAERALWYNVSIMLGVLILTISLTITAAIVWMILAVV